jgi:putative DNA primase/helicase
MTHRPRKPGATRTERVITADLLREAMGFIDPNIGHDERARVAFAGYDALGDAFGAIFLDWAGQRSKPDAAKDRSTWRSARKPGAVRVGTLLRLAQEGGFKFPEADSATPAPDPAALAAATAEREAKRQADEAAYRAVADKVAELARRLWDGASEQGHSPYLTRKGVQGHGVRYQADGTLLVPVRNAAGALQSLQTIAPEKPSDGKPEKRFLRDGRKAGLWHWIGQAPAARAEPSADACTVNAFPVLLLAEGYATGASVHEATGYPLAVCFDAGNLAAVAKVLRALYPAALLVMCGDDDLATQARTGENPGRKKATAAARATNTDTGRAVAVFPAALPDGGSDFNDMHQHAGLDAVRACVLAAIDAARESASEGMSNDTTCPPIDATPAGASSEAPPAAETASTAAERPAAVTSGAARPKKRAKARDSSGGDDAAGSAADPPGFDRFTCDDSGVWFRPPAADDGSTANTRRVCDRLEVLALARDMQDRCGALLLEFDSAFGNRRRWLMPLSMLAGDGAEYRRELLDMGFIAPTDGNRRRWLTEYLQSRRPTDRVRMVDRVGWHGRAYVLPRETLRPAPKAGHQEAGEASDTIMFHSDAPMEDTFGRRGTLAQWHGGVGRLCVGNSRLAFAVSTALAGSILAWVPGMESGGFHLRGDSSSGKTTALRVAASVWGGRNYLQRWRATDNGLEAQAAQHSDALLVLDELGQLDARVAGESAYMLANGQGKARAGRNGGARARLSWRLLWLSAGEIPLAEHMAEAGKRIRAGQELRMVDMPADAGAGLGLFETVHDFDGGAAMAQHLAKACETTYGTLGRAWLEWLTDHSDEWPRALRERVETLSQDFVPGAADGQVQRAARRFALVAAAGELATEQGFTEWPEKTATVAARACFLSWINARPAGWGSSEKTEALRQVQAWLEKNADALLTWWHRAMDDHRPNTALRGGFRRLVDDAGDPVKFDAATAFSDERSPLSQRSTAEARVEFVLFPEAFKREVCKGLDVRFVSQVLKAAGCLKHDAGHDTTKLTVPGIGRTRMYHVLPSVFASQAEQD